MIAALYVDPRGPYASMPDVDPWDEARDARKYAGPWPVVAHPPCGPWGKLRHLSRHQDPSLAPIAVEQVRTWGGILEHPSHSKLWAHCGLPPVNGFPDAWGGYTIAVQQVNWGHPMRKRTWLYMVGVPSIGPIPPTRAPTHWASGGRQRPDGSYTHTPCPPHIRIASAQQRRRTPPAFARWLVDLAHSVALRV